MIPGFSREQCRPITTDGLTQSVEWDGAPELPRGKPVCLVFELRNAKLFGCRCNDK